MGVKRNYDQDLDTIQRMAVELHASEQIHVAMSAFEAYTVLAIIQLAWRHPDLNDFQKSLIESFGRALQGEIAKRAPFAGETLEAGWNPEYDVPRERGST